MNILFCDYPSEMQQDFTYEKEYLKKHLPAANIICRPYYNQQQLINDLHNIDVLRTAFIPVNNDVFAASKLKFISVNAAGYDTIDLAAAKKHNVHIMNVPDYCTNEVAEHTMALMLSLARHLKTYDQQISTEHIWQFQTQTDIYRLYGKTMALFGWGKISQAVAKRAAAFGIKTLVVSQHLTEEQAALQHVECANADTALAQADIISNHMQPNIDNHNYFSAQIFNKMNYCPLFLNTGRGSTVDESALISALQSKKIAGAGLDVLASETPDLINNPLTKMNNVIITPHAAFYSQESLQDLSRRSCENIISFFTDEQKNYII
ncbi:2-hydroxyacid dehydrogenase [Pectinatus brassicae]|uniref:D-3-phosphoglycerate dehydrogenase n=1 Tax=Pectinatus brassicae TaxID=862415 RepID=A0A840URC5_9FIRM|nr:NAD(P)-dependent oxidoreductase [Pectinatus brassicae]MBB5336712.1 D-3-phosphoglycerate dehydrogenase [Pectinatus brassicae]